MPDEVRREDAAKNRFETAETLRLALTEAGFASVSVNVEETVLFFPDEETLWLAVTSGGMGRILDIAGPSALPNIRQDIVEAARAKREERGFPVRFRALVAFGTKSE